MEIGALVAQRRQECGMSQDAVTTALKNIGVFGFGRDALGNLESGRTKTIAPDVAAGLARILPVTIAELCIAMGYDLPDYSREPTAHQLLALHDLLRSPEQRELLVATAREVTRGLLRLEQHPPQSVSHPALLPLLNTVAAHRGRS